MPFPCVLYILIQRWVYSAMSATLRNRIQTLYLSSSWLLLPRAWTLAPLPFFRNAEDYIWEREEEIQKRIGLWGRSPVMQWWEIIRRAYMWLYGNITDNTCNTQYWVLYAVLIVPHVIHGTQQVAGCPIQIDMQLHMSIWNWILACTVACINLWLVLSPK